MKKLITFLILTTSGLTVAKAQNNIPDENVFDKIVDLIENESEYSVISSTDNEAQLSRFDPTFNSRTKETFTIPEQWADYGFNYHYGDIFYFFDFTKNCELVSGGINVKTKEVIQNPNLQLGNCDEIGVGGLAKWDFQLREDGSLLLLCSSGRTNDFNTVKWMISVFSIAEGFSHVNWSHVIDEPDFEVKKARADYKSFRSLGPDDFIISFEGGVQGNLNKLSNYTYLYRHTGQGLIIPWQHQTPQVPPQEKIEGQPYPFLDKDGAFKYFIPVYKEGESDRIKLYLKDEENVVLKEYKTQFKLPKLSAKYYVDFTTGVFLNTENPLKSRVLLMIEDGRKMKGKHPKYFVNLLLNEEEIEDQYFIDGKAVPLLRIPRKMLCVKDYIMFEGALLLIKEDKVHYAVNEVFLEGRAELATAKDKTAAPFYYFRKKE